MIERIDDRIRAAIDEAVAEVSAATGQEIYLVETLIRGGGRKIDLTVDTDSGIGIQQCAKLSRRIRDILENPDGMPADELEAGDFELTVSSPGLGEPIRVKRQYLRHLGRLIRAVVIDEDDERREVEGRLLQAVVGEEPDPYIVLEPVVSARKKKLAPPEPVTLRLSEIVKASVQTEF